MNSPVFQPFLLLPANANTMSQLNIDSELIIKGGKLIKL